MMRTWNYLVVALALLPNVVQAADEYPTLGTVECFDPRFRELIPEDARMERLAEGFDWAEGPVWDKAHECLYFSDIPPNRVMKWSAADGLSLFLEPAGYTGNEPRGGEPGSNGLLINADGRLVLMQHGDRRVALLAEDGRSFVTLADRYDGRRFNSPNDACFKSNGDLYFTDPPYGLVGNFDDPAREQEWCGVYRLATDGQVTLLTSEMTRPNGIAFSPDEKTLYVAQSDPAAAIWMAFDVCEDGTITNGRCFCDMTSEVGKIKGLPDGLKVDQHGNLFATGPGGVCVFAPDGTLLGRLNTGEATANCGWGDDGRTLYITADMYLARIRTTTQGVGF